MKKAADALSEIVFPSSSTMLSGALALGITGHGDDAKEVDSDDADI
jgi:hypothetical protein